MFQKTEPEDYHSLKRRKYHRAIACGAGVCFRSASTDLPDATYRRDAEPIRSLSVAAGNSLRCQGVGGLQPETEGASKVAQSTQKHHHGLRKHHPGRDS
ncbi:hypothetical protein GN956_G5006 [Arapaima gigas]